MQPYFMPYIGYMSLIKHTDQFILFDTVQFIRHGWIERNRVLKQNEGWLYIKAPLVKDNSRPLIKDCIIDNSKKWQNTIKAQLQTYKKIAPNYIKIMQLLDEIFSKEHTTITSFNKSSLEVIAGYLGFPKELPVFSEMNMNIEEPKEADEWALNICKELASEGRKVHYINPIGGMEFFDREKYSRNGIDISFQKIEISEYPQKREMFESGLSIIDVLMFNSVEEVNEMLDKYELI